MCSFGLKVTWQCVGLELCSKTLWYCPWQVSVCCATSVPGRAAGRRIFLIPSERQEKKLLPCLLLLWAVGLLFFFFYSIPTGVIYSWKYTAFFFKLTDLGFRMSHVQLWQYEKPHLFKRHWYIKHIYWNPNLRFLKQMCRKKKSTKNGHKTKKKPFKVKITMNFSSHCKHFPNYCF